jgi:formamidopyrimidine-DNA glycosylase
LDQNFISGIGNIYANEILFYSKINPIKSGYKIKKNEIIKLIKYSKIVLNLAIKFGGSSIRDFKSTSGSYGSFQKEFKIYGKEGENCSKKNCSDKIIKIYQSNRSTFFCKSCQI